MLFARFLAENNLLVHPDYGESISLDEVKELAREQNGDWLSIAASFAQRMLLEVFRPDDPVLDLILPPETRQKLEEKLAALPKEVFTAKDSLGWVYQFWQRDEKDRVNKSEVKIGADELPAVTQLFTEDYMVLFLLENTLGAWWTAKRRAEGKDPALPGYDWTYLRLNEDGSPAAGGFDGWPRAARDLRVLDPSMGSGHFLVFALPVLARMRMEEEGRTHREALAVVLKDNLFGLEIDARCAQIAAFNLALAAWRLAGEHFSLPEMNLACSGLGIHASEADWVKLAGADGQAREEMRRLYSLFKDAPTLGSLIDPLRLRATVFSSGAERVLPLIEEALQQERSEETRELAIAARGVLAAFRILASRFTLVATNVPYLGRGKQDPDLAKYCAEFHAEAKADLATCFVDRCLRFSIEGGSVALVTPQNWLFLTSYKTLRERLLKNDQWDFVARLGPRAFETITGEVVNVSLVGLTRHTPSPDHTFAGWDVGEAKTPAEKAVGLSSAVYANPQQSSQQRSPGHAITFENADFKQLLAHYAKGLAGVLNGDTARFEACYWEVNSFGAIWEFEQSTVEDTVFYGGREKVILWEGGSGRLRSYAAEVKERLHDADRRGNEAWGKWAVSISQMRSLPATLSTGEKFDTNVGVILPFDPSHLLPIWAYCSSAEYVNAVRRITQKLNVTNATLVSVEFDLAQWQRVAAEKYPSGLPKPHSSDPTQWLFCGQPKGSAHPLQVAVARLLGYQWPRQTGSSFPDCPTLDPDGLEPHADEDGIVTLSSLAGEAPAADRLRALLAEAYGAEWSAANLQELLGDCEALEVWLRDRFFEEHCRIFHQRPFLWHIWDGRKDGFHAFVNYHKLAGPNGDGRKTLEKVIYTSLGDWITRQRAEVSSGVEGAEARLTAALHLKGELERILVGENPYDLFIRWKPLHEQPIGWEPDINDGVRLNIRPWLQTTLPPSTKPKKGACVLRVTPKINYGKDRGKEPLRPREDFPWFWSWDEKSEDFQGGKDFDGARWNDLHYSPDTKEKARLRVQAKEGLK